MGEPANRGAALAAPPEVDELDLIARAEASLAPGLCPLCRGDRAVITPGATDVCVCPLCHGDGLAPRPSAAVADAARLSVDWLT